MRGSAVASIFVGVLACMLLFAGVGSIEVALLGAPLTPMSQGLNLGFGIVCSPIGFGLFMVANHLWSPRTWRGSALVSLAVSSIAAGIGLQSTLMSQAVQLAGWGLIVAGTFAVYLLARQIRAHG